MKQVLTPEDVSLLEDCLNHASPGPWSVLEDDGVDTAWVTSSTNNKPIALFDYEDGVQNRADAHFVVSARNCMSAMLIEIKTLRRRVLELIQSNNLEVQKRLDIQTELMELKKLQDENS